MPPLFTMRIGINQQHLDDLRTLPERAQRIFRRKLQTELKPEAQRMLESLMPLDPGPPDSPFAFGTDRSKRYYLWLVTNFPDLSDGEHWKRTGEIDKGFYVEISDRLRLNLIRIIDNHPKAKYVYGPWQVQGHADTGWLAEALALKQIMREWMIGRIREMWKEAWAEARRGKDS